MTGGLRPAYARHMVECRGARVCLLVGLAALAACGDDAVPISPALDAQVLPDLDDAADGAGDLGGEAERDAEGDGGPAPDSDGTAAAEEPTGRAEVTVETREAADLVAEAASDLDTPADTAESIDPIDPVEDIDDIRDIGDGELDAEPEAEVDIIAPESWPDGLDAPHATVTLVAEGRVLSPGETLRLRTGPAGRSGRVTLALVVTNHSTASLALGAPADWLSVPEGAEIGWETPPPEGLAPEASARLVLAVDGRSAPSAILWQAVLAVPGTDLAVGLHVEVPRPLRLVVAGDGGFIAVSDDSGASFRTAVSASGASDPTRLRSLSWGEGRFFLSRASGQGWETQGLYATSQDGLAWTSSAVAPEFWTAHCIHALGRFVCARSGAFTWSEDGRVVIHEAMTWTPFINALATDGEKIVGVGRVGRRAISRDGRSWTEEHPHAVQNEYASIIHANGRFVAVGGADNFVISTSSDGVAWADQVWAPSRWARMSTVAWNGHIFLATGHNNDARPMWRSQDALSWESVLETGPWESYVLLGAFNGFFYGVRRFEGNNGLFRSVDGSRWQLVLSVLATQALSAMAQEGFDRPDPSLTTDDGRGDDWDLPGAGTGPDPGCPGLSVEVDGVRLDVDDAATDAVVDLGLSPALGEARLVSLTLGNPCDRPIRLLGHPETWLAGTAFALDTLPPVAVPARGAVSLVVSWQPGGEEGVQDGALSLPHDGPRSPLRVDLVGESGPPLRVVGVGDGGYRVASANYGDSFTFEGWATTVAHTRDLIRGACWGAGRFVGVGGNGESVSWVSDDGVTWRDYEQPGPWLADCAYGNGRFVAAGGVPLVSLNGAAWTQGTNAAPRHIRTMVFGGGVFVGGGDAGTVVTTTDGANWERVATAGVDGLRASAWGGGVFVLAGENGAVAASRDGAVTWLAQRISGAGMFQGVAFAGGRFYAGDGAATYVSADGVGWTRVNAAGGVVPRVGFGRTLLGWGGHAMHRSHDGGFTWQRTTAGTGGLGVLDMAVEGTEGP